VQDVVKVYADAYHKSKCLEGLFIHDISNLFQIISNSIELCETLLKEEEVSDVFTEYFQMISQQLTRGKKLIRNARTLSDLDEYKMCLEPVEVFSELKNAIDFSRISFPNKEIKVNVASGHVILYTFANELLSEVFENIVNNAIKYNRCDPVRIEVIVSKVEIQKENYIKIEFKDNGIGIDDTRKRTIFQEVHLKRRHSMGMGLGLSLVAKLMQIYGGKIWVEDRIEGDSSKGTNFIILLPFVKKKVGVKWKIDVKV
jgi:signal transduction histidine kinase